MPDWYVDVGSAINTTLIVNCFLSNFLDLRSYVARAQEQWRDRGCKGSRRKYPDDPDDDEPNTGKLVQEDLEKLYEGEEFEGEKNLSRMMSTLLVLLFYSSGMPIVYFIGFVYFSVTFLVNKLLLFRHYQRTESALSATIPEYCLELLRYGILLKLLVGIATLNCPAVWVTNKPPHEKALPSRFKIDVREKLAQSSATGSSFLRQQADGRSESHDFLEYVQYMHQQCYLGFVAGLISLYIFWKFGVGFGSIVLGLASSGILSACSKAQKGCKYALELTRALLTNCGKSCASCCRRIAGKPGRASRSRSRRSKPQPLPQGDAARDAELLESSEGSL